MRKRPPHPARVLATARGQAGVNLFSGRGCSNLGEGGPLSLSAPRADTTASPEILPTSDRKNYVFVLFFFSVPRLGFCWERYFQYLSLLKILRGKWCNPILRLDGTGTALGGLGDRVWIGTPPSENVNAKRAPVRRRTLSVSPPKACNSVWES